MSIELGLKEIESQAVGFIKQTYPSSSNLYGDKLLYTYAEKNLQSTPYGNLFKSFNFPITVAEKVDYTTRYGSTALKWLDVDKIIVVEIPKGEYGELIDGKTFQLTLPVTLGGVETATTVYGTYFGYDGINAASFLGNQLNTRRSEINQSYFGFEPTQDNGFNTNVTFLYSNDIATPKDKGNVITVLTATTVTITGDISSKFIFTSVTLNSNEVVKVSFDLTNQNLTNDVIVDVQGFQLTNKSFKQINQPGIVSVNVTAYLSNTNGQNPPIPKEITITIEKQQSANSLSWDVWSANNKFPRIEGDEGQKIYASYDSVKSNGVVYPGYDQPVGILYQDKGFAVITDSTLVQNFRYTAGTSTGYNGIPSGTSYNLDKNFAKIFFPTIGISNSQFVSITTEFEQNIVCLAGPGEFVQTTNSTYENAYEQDATEKPVFITSIGLYNAAGELIGIGKLSEPVKKLPNTVVPFNIRLVV
jgi:hypothetical protein